MKKKFIYSAFLACGMIVSTCMSGCSVFKPAKTSEGSGKGLQGWVSDTKEEVKTGADDIIKNTKKDIAKTEESLGLKATPVEGKALQGDWAILEVLGKKAVGEEPPCIMFVANENRIYGNNGCNVLNADFTADYAAHKLSFGHIATTMKLCGQSGITDVEIGQALGMTASFKVTSADTDATLRLFDAQGNEVMMLMHRDFHFLDGTWAVEEIDGEKVKIAGMKIAIDVDEKRIHGNTGCNIINGDLETDMDTANSISFSKIGMTKMACPDSGWETRMVMALEEAVCAEKIPGADRVALIGSNGKKVMVLKKTSPIED